MRLAKSMAENIALSFDDISFCSFYSESGYKDNLQGIFFANWNRHERLQIVLEKLGFGVEWSDEWTICNECCGAVRISPDSYYWECFFVVLSGDIVCLDCAEKRIDEVFSEYENDPTRVLPSFFEPEKHGYKLIRGEMESGFHPGQDDNPKDVYKKHERSFDSLIFRIDNKEQFSLGFSLWGKNYE